MKKIFVLSLLVFFATVSLTTAATKTFTDGAKVEETGGELISTLSSKVDIGINSDTEAYAAQTAHSSGSKMYGGSSNEAKLKWSSYDGTLGTPGSSDSAAFSADTWEEL